MSIFKDSEWPFCHPYNLYCIGGDVKPCTINQSVNGRYNGIFGMAITVPRDETEKSARDIVTPITSLLGLYILVFLYIVFSCLFMCRITCLCILYSMPLLSLPVNGY